MELTTEIFDVSFQVQLVKRAEVSIRSSVQPDRIWHGGQVMGESAMRALADIGPRVTHTFQVTNDGPWHVDEMEVVIHWPFQLAPPLGKKTGQGKWLLYLTDAPEITPPGAGQCFLNPRTINSLGLRERGVGDSRLTSGVSDSAVKKKKKRKRRKRTARVTDNDDIDIDDAINSSNFITSDITVDSSDSSSSSNNEKVSLFSDPSSGFVLDCSSDSVQCHIFSCRLSNLRANESAVIRIRSRVWNSTLVEEFPEAQLVVIQSRAKVVLPKLLDMHQVNDGNFDSPITITFLLTTLFGSYFICFNFNNTRWLNIFGIVEIKTGYWNELKSRAFKILSFSNLFSNSITKSILEQKKILESKLNKLTKSKQRKTFFLISSHAIKKEQKKQKYYFLGLKS